VLAYDEERRLPPPGGAAVGGAAAVVHRRRGAIHHAVAAAREEWVRRSGAGRHGRRPWISLLLVSLTLRQAWILVQTLAEHDSERSSVYSYY
jgi:hypothetical protein